MTKAEACVLFGELKTPEGDKKACRRARSRNKAAKNVNHVKLAKDTNGVALTYERKIQERRKEYFKSLLNEENRRKYQDDGILTQVSRAVLSEQKWRGHLKKKQ